MSQVHDEVRARDIQTTNCPHHEADASPFKVARGGLAVQTVHTFIGGRSDKLQPPRFCSRIAANRIKKCAPGLVSAPATPQ